MEVAAAEYPKAADRYKETRFDPDSTMPKPWASIDDKGELILEGEKAMSNPTTCEKLI